MNNEKTSAIALAEIESIIAANVGLLGESAPTIGVHVLRDGRVRIFDLASGWRRHPYREYHSIGRALEEAREAHERAKRVHELTAKGGTLAEAIAEVVA